MRTFDEFNALISSIDDERLWPKASSLLSDMHLVSIYVASGNRGLIATFEIIDFEEEEQAVRHEFNAVQFSVVFEQVSDVIMNGLAVQSSCSVSRTSDGLYLAELRSSASGIQFKFSSVAMMRVSWSRAHRD